MLLMLMLVLSPRILTVWGTAWPPCTQCNLLSLTSCPIRLPLSGQGELVLRSGYPATPARPWMQWVSPTLTGGAFP